MADDTTPLLSSFRPWSTAIFDLPLANYIHLKPCRTTDGAGCYAETNGLDAVGGGCIRSGTNSIFRSLTPRQSVSAAAGELQTMASSLLLRRRYGSQQGTKHRSSCVISLSIRN